MKNYNKKVSAMSLGHVSVIAIPLRRTIRPVVADMARVARVNVIAMTLAPAVVTRAVVASPGCIVAERMCAAAMTMRR